VIKVDRAVATPATSWRSTASAATDQAISDGPGHAVSDAIYAHDEIRAVLETVFSHKCAYCESEPTATGAWDVEHFRPKGRVDTRPDHPGYYWLAYSWTNLYLSCPHCNQRRKDKPVAGDMRTLPARGKLDQFPLRDEATRAMQPADVLEAEDRLLLDPCTDNPEEHLAIGVKGKIVALNDSEMGATTVDVCRLDRRRLDLARQKVVKTALELIEQFTPSAGLAASIDAVTATLGQPELPYALVARSIAAQPEAFGLQ
jgi:uncharacterized protein (TIGR02646 family)